MNDIPKIQSKAILEESEVPSLSGIEKSKVSADTWLSEIQKGPFRDEHGEEQDIKDSGGGRGNLPRFWVGMCPGRAKK